MQKTFRYFLQSGRTPPVQKVFSGTAYPERIQGQEKIVPSYIALILLGVTTFLATPLSQPIGCALMFKCMMDSTDAASYWNKMMRFVLVHRSHTQRRDSFQPLHPPHSSDWEIGSYHGKCFRIKTNNNFIFSFPIQLKIKMGWVYIKGTMKSMVIPLLSEESSFPNAKIKNGMDGWEHEVLRFGGITLLIFPLSVFSFIKWD